MDETTYHTWWALHLRATRGEHLNSEEQATYEAGLRQLQQEETGDQDILTLQQTRTTVAALEAEQARLHARHEQLNAEIAALEHIFPPHFGERRILSESYWNSCSLM
jgi:hypothetical protein